MMVPVIKTNVMRMILYATHPSKKKKKSCNLKQLHAYPHIAAINYKLHTELMQKRQADWLF